MVRLLVLEMRKRMELELTFRSVLVSLDEMSPSEPSSLLCVADLV